MFLLLLLICTFQFFPCCQNGGAVQECVACGKPRAPPEKRSQPQPQPAAAGQSIECAVCTLLNAPGDRTCRACGSDLRARANPRFPAQPQQVSCSRCTLLNPADNDVCLACFEPLEKPRTAPAEGKAPASGMVATNQQAATGGAAIGPAPSLPPPAQTGTNVPRSLSLPIQQQHDEEQQRAEQLLKQVLERCQASGENFVDPDFPPCDASLYGTRGPRAAEASRHLQWRRIADLRSAHEGSQWPVEALKVYHFISALDVQQGSLGNCWFVSALAVLAEQPQRVQQLFFSRSDYQPVGIYLVRRLCGGNRGRKLL